MYFLKKCSRENCTIIEVALRSIAKFLNQSKEFCNRGRYKHLALDRRATLILSVISLPYGNNECFLLVYLFRPVSFNLSENEDTSCISMPLTEDILLFPRTSKE